MWKSLLIKWQKAQSKVYWEKLIKLVQQTKVQVLVVVISLCINMKTEVVYQDNKPVNVLQYFAGLLA